MPASTLLEAVRTSLAHAARYNPGDVVAPAAVLWTDADGQWRPVAQQLRGLMPELLTLGDYEPTTRTGPAIWLRCVIEPAVRADKFPDLAWPAETVPVIYMPGVSRQTLRAVEECPDSLKPLVELQYRGAVWTQKNGKDWTVRAFLVSEDGGLGLDVAEDKLTLQAMQGALSQLAVTPVGAAARQAAGGRGLRQADDRRHATRPAAVAGRSGRCARAMGRRQMGGVSQPVPAGLRLRPGSGRRNRRG